MVYLKWTNFSLKWILPYINHNSYIHNWDNSTIKEQEYIFLQLDVTSTLNHTPYNVKCFKWNIQVLEWRPSHKLLLSSSSFWRTFHTPMHSCIEHNYLFSSSILTLNTFSRTNCSRNHLHMPNNLPIDLCTNNFEPLF